MGLARLQTGLGKRSGETEAFQLGLEYGEVRMDFRHLFVEVAEAEDVGEDSPVVEVSDGVAEGEEKGRGSGKQIPEPVGHGLGRRGTEDGAGVDVGDVGFRIGSVLGR